MGRGVIDELPQCDRLRSLYVKFAHMQVHRQVERLRRGLPKLSPDDWSAQAFRKALISLPQEKWELVRKGMTDEALKWVGR